MSRWSATLVALLLSGFARQSSAANNDPAVTITPSRITVSRITPGGRVLFFGAGFEPKRYYAQPHRWSSVVTDAHRDGVVAYDLDQPVMWNAVWIIVDLTSGRYAISSTPGYTVMRPPRDRHDFKHDALGAVSRFVFARPAADFLYIAPGGGAWKQLARDGEDTDGDGVPDGFTTIDLSRLEALDAGDRPRAFVPGGTLFVIDPTRLELLELKIDASLLGRAH